MELIIKETENIKKKTRLQDPVFKIEDGVLIDCELNGSKTVTIPN